MIKRIPLFALCLLLWTVKDCVAEPWKVTSMTVGGGPIASKHFQSGDADVHERHAIATLKFSTENHGNWGIYFLSPNSVRNTSVGAGYVTDPFTIPLGPTQLELTGALGLVTGYQDYPVPFVSGAARLAFYQNGPWNAGLEMGVMPYLGKSGISDENTAGVVVTTPFLSLRYSFN